MLKNLQDAFGVKSPGKHSFANSGKILKPLMDFYSDIKVYLWVIVKMEKMPPKGPTKPDTAQQNERLSQC